MHISNCFVMHESFVRIRFVTLLGHNRTVGLCTQNKNKDNNKKKAQVLTWKAHNDGKNHDSPQAAEYTMGEKITTVEAQGQRPLALLSSPHAAVTMEATTSLSLSLSLYLCARAIQLTLQNVSTTYLKCVP